jgi:hypothetical protein
MSTPKTIKLRNFLSFFVSTTALAAGGFEKIPKEKYCQLVVWDRL